jgi:hypothetical protein
MGHSHRLDGLFGSGRIKQRIFALVTVGYWLGFSVYLLLPRDATRFAQSNCDEASLLVKQIFLAPFIMIIAIATTSAVATIAFFIPLLLVILSWVWAVFHRRNALWTYTGHRKRPTFWVVWCVATTVYLASREPSSR